MRSKTSNDNYYLLTMAAIAQEIRYRREERKTDVVLAAGLPLAMSAPVYRERSGCSDRDDALEGMSIAMAYVPWQSWRHIYEAGKGFHRGTIFEELDLPFKGKGGCNA